MDQGLGQHRDHVRVASESPIADDAAAAVVQVEHRRKAQIDPAGPQLGRQHMAGGGGRIARNQR